MSRLLAAGFVKRLRPVLLIVISGLQGQVGAQIPRSTLHLGPMHFESVFKNDGFAPCAVRISYERDMGMGLMYGFDLHVLWRSVLNQEPIVEVDPLEHEGWEVHYSKNRRGWGMSYRTAFFFAGDGEAGGYLGSIIGFRQISAELITREAYSPSGATGPNPFQDGYAAETIVFPVGLRLGMRGGWAYGFESDIYLGLSYQIGGGRNLIDEPELEGGPTELAGLTYTMGFAWMIEL